MTADQAPLISVVTVSYGSAHVLSGFLGSVPAASAHALDVIVVDNKPNGSDGVSELTAQHGARYLPMSRNAGYGRAMDAGAATAPASVKWIVISNPDIVFAPGAIDAMVAAAETSPDIGAVGPVVLTPEGDVYPSARSIPSLRTGVGHALLANVWPQNPWSRTYRQESEAPPRTRDAGWLSGSCMLVRRSAFDAVGGFDPGYFMYFEDVDLGYRLGQAGWRNVYTPDASVTHAGAHSTEQHSGLMIRAHHKSAYRFLASRYHGWKLWPVRAGLRISLGVRGWLLSRRGLNH